MTDSSRQQDQTGAVKPKYRKPAQAPTAADIAERDAWNALTARSLEDVQAAAEKWRNGLAAFLALVTSGLILKGPGSAAEVDPTWRAWITGLSALGLVLAIIGLWLALKAAAGTPARVSLPAIRAHYGTVEQFKVAKADDAAGWLANARVLIACGLVLLLVAVGLWAWAPAAPAAPAAYVKIKTGKGAICGELKSADGQMFRVQVSGEARPQEIPYAKATNVLVVDQC